MMMYVDFCANSCLETEDDGVCQCDWEEGLRMCA